MRFKLEKEDAPGKDCSNAPRYMITTKVRVNSETTVSLPAILMSLLMSLLISILKCLIRGVAQ